MSEGGEQMSRKVLKPGCMLCSSGEGWQVVGGESLMLCC